MKTDKQNDAQKKLSFAKKALRKLKTKSGVKAGVTKIVVTQCSNRTY